MVIESDEVSSRLRGSTGEAVGRSERSSLSTQGIFLPKGVEDRDDVAPKCHCWVYVVRYMSKTTNNPNRRLGCLTANFFSG
ncbi:hypothetical protein PIB30_038136 [Stylosanthes scabra]|uniref:Uncharacterized protein n=1 Tax=Stylosanthes scabra TaxID=79078 RepID=A0ABU6VCP6_9FABA|nr:hypothetical protein [Stylosanthes scabra]